MNGFSGASCANGKALRIRGSEQRDRHTRGAEVDKDVSHCSVVAFELRGFDDAKKENSKN